MNARLTPKQFCALAAAAATNGHVIAHGRTIQTLVKHGFVEGVFGWYERSISRRVGRIGATSSTWGVIGYKITQAGRDVVTRIVERRALRAPSYYLTSPTGVLHLRASGPEDDGLSAYYARCGWYCEVGSKAIPVVVPEESRFCGRCEVIEP